MFTSKNLDIANPLPAALRHLEAELGHVLGSANLNLNRRSYNPVEKSPGLSRLRLLRNALQNSLRDSRNPSPVLVLWPSLGYLEFVIRHRCTARQIVMVHDPIPLRAQVGMGSGAKVITKLLQRPHVEAIVLSADAYRDLRRILPRVDLIRLPHPIGPYRGEGVRKNRVLLVAGQYKPARDIELLREIAPALAAVGWKLRVVGRGWPVIPGCEVENRFLSEDELDKELAAASAIFLPYNHYYQSGIAVRALEVGTLPLGNKTSFLEDLLGRHSFILPPVLTVESILRALDVYADVEVSGVHAEYEARAKTAWKHYLSSL